MIDWLIDWFYRKISAFPFFHLLSPRKYLLEESQLSKSKYCSQKTIFQKPGEIGDISPSLVDIFGSSVHPFHSYLNAVLPGNWTFRKDVRYYCQKHLISKKLSVHLMVIVVLLSKTWKKIIMFARGDSYTLLKSFLFSGYFRRTEMSFAFTNETWHNLVLHGLGFCNESFTLLDFIK